MHYTSPPYRGDFRAKIVSYDSNRNCLVSSLNFHATASHNGTTVTCTNRDRRSNQSLSLHIVKWVEIIVLEYYSRVEKCMVCIGCLKVMLMFVYVTLCAEWLEFTACYVCQVVCPELKVSMIRGVSLQKKTGCLQETCSGYQKFILVLEVNCISNLSLNHTLQLTTLRTSVHERVTMHHCKRDWFYSLQSC